MADVKIPDLYEIDSLLTKEEKAVRETTASFVKKALLPVIVKHHREATFPIELVSEMGKIGLLGTNLSGYGCPGLSNLAYGLVMQELEKGDSSIRSFVSVQSSLVMYAIHKFGSEEQKNNWLPKLARGQAIGCFGLTEPDFGSDPGGMRTRAEKNENNFILNGAKMWITNGTISDIAVVWAKSLDDKINGYLVEKGTEGFSAPEMKGKFSMRASVTSELIFDNCIIPENNILPKTKGLGSALSCLNQARYSIAWGAAGSAMACYNAAREYALSRIQFDKPIASFQIIQQKLVYMLTEITKMQLINFRLASLKDDNIVNHAQISLAKRNNVYHALRIARVARDMLGANGIIDEYPVIRHLLNLETVKTYEGTHDIHSLILGEYITGIPAFR
jgi:glutaryl-CoA dehydrogenase